MSHYKEIEYGFEYGAATVERFFRDEKRGWVVISLKTPRTTLQIYVTKTGMVKIFNMDGKRLA